MHNFINRVKTTLSSFAQFPFYFILFSEIPLVILIDHNFVEMEIKDSYRLFLYSAILGLLLFTAFYLLIRKSNKAAFAATGTALVMMSYGHIYDIFRAGFPDQALIIRHRYIIPVILVFLLVILWFIWKRIPEQAIQRMTLPLNLIAILMVGFNLFGIVRQSISTNKSLQAGTKSSISSQIQSQTGYPDIYFIVMDSYTRADVLNDYFGYDNSEFINELENLGFYVPRCSQSNYNFTFASLSATFNMDYLSNLDMKSPISMRDKELFIDLFQNNPVFSRLKERGYQVYSFQSTYPWLEWKEATVQIRKSSTNTLNRNLQPFELLFLQGTIARYFVDKTPSVEADSIRKSKFDEIRFLLEALNGIDDTKQAQMVFLDLDITHDPLVFNSDGTFNPDMDLKSEESGSYKSDYIQGVKYANQQILSIVKNILAKSTIPPVIFIQADHGIRNIAYTNMIFSSYYIPGGDQFFYPNLSPVNNFRILENVYFENPIPLLPDLAFRKVGDDLYHFNEIQDPNPACQ